MAKILTPLQTPSLLPPNSLHLYDLARLINYVPKITAAGDMLAAVQAAAGVQDLRARIEGLAVRVADQQWLRALSDAIEFANGAGQLDDTDVQNFTTVNTAPGVTTDMLWGLCTQNDSSLNALTGSGTGAIFAWKAPAIPTI